MTTGGLYVDANSGIESLADLKGKKRSALLAVLLIRAGYYFKLTVKKNMGLI